MRDSTAKKCSVHSRKTSFSATTVYYFMLTPEEVELFCDDGEAGGLRHVKRAVAHQVARVQQVLHLRQAHTKLPSVYSGSCFMLTGTVIAQIQEQLS